MKCKVQDLSGPALDWAVASALGSLNTSRMVRPGTSAIQAELNSRGQVTAWDDDKFDYGLFEPTTNWKQGGPIIEKQEIELLKWAIDGWKAKDTNYQFLNTPQERVHFAEMYGPTPLIAAMRCYVASKLGEEIEIPEELK